MQSQKTKKTIDRKPQGRNNHTGMGHNQGNTSGHGAQP